MRNGIRSVVCLFAGMALLVFSGCSSTWRRPVISTTTYTLGGTVSGLSGTGLVLVTGGGHTLPVTANGSFTFSQPIPSGFSYTVLILTPPSSPALQSCTVTNGSGIAEGNVTNIQVACAAASAPTPIPVPTMALNEWTWVGGSSTVNQNGWYGTLGTASAINSPGARNYATSWTDTAGNLWLFGGAGQNVGGWCGTVDPLCTSGTNSYYNDLWKFNGSEWTWVAGSNTVDMPGTYGTQGTAASGNAPGARYGAVSWTDLSGNLWLFGGTGYDSAGNVGYLNDLWKFSGGQWTWMGGANVVNQTGVYGTQGTAAAGNFPGARSGAVSLTDASGNLWLFGGQGCAGFCGAYLNDLWEYSGGQWKWVSGQNVYNPTQPGVYGTQGTAAAGNQPGGRSNASGWIDHSGNIWIFGGVGWGSWVGNVAELNDLWKYSGGQWTWMSGPDESYASVDQPGTYGTQGTAASGNTPGARDSALSWTDAMGNLWLFGGEGFSASGGGYLNDMWKYSGGEWTWVSGSNAAGQVGSYGTQGTPAAGNLPGAHWGATGWVDPSGNLWLFGGVGNGSTTGSGFLNDQWVYEP